MPPEGYEVLTIYFRKEEVVELNKIIEAARALKMTKAAYAREMIRRGMEIPTTPQIDFSAAHEDREEIIKLRRELRDKTAAFEKLETELFTLKNSLFLEPVRGKAQFPTELLELLQNGRTWRSQEIMESLHIDTKNIEALQILANQLHTLQDLHLVEEGPKGWRWIG